MLFNLKPNVMKNLTTFMLLLVVILFTSCDPVDNDSSNYWNSSMLVHMQLKGKVHTLTQNENVTEFNSDGQMVRNGQATYSYDAQGRMVSDGSSTFQYNNLGKYVPNFPFHINYAGLTPNLSAIIEESSRVDYSFRGDSLWMITQYSYEAVVTYDTLKVYFPGKYPVSFVSDYSFMNATYQANGMFDVYTEGFYGVGYNDARKFTYKKDAEYLLIDKREDSYTAADPTNSFSSTTDFTYNSHKDLVKEEQRSTGSYYITEYYDYEYDAKGNWTSRKIHTQNNSPTWDNDRVETRTISYFD